MKEKLVNIDKMMLSELKQSCFRSSKLIFSANTLVSKGTAINMLKAGALENRKRTAPKDYPLAFVPMQSMKVEAEEQFQGGDEEMSMPNENSAGSFT